MQYRNQVRRTLLLFMLAGIVSCQHSQTPVTVNATEKDSTRATGNCNMNDYMTGAVLYQQQSGEYRALAYQAFALAKIVLDNSLKHRKHGDTLAIITDLDETMLDNSKYDAQVILKGASDWEQWVNAKQADSLAGSVSFLKYADSKRVNIYYISNRDAKDVSSTMENMRHLGFPQLDSSHFCFNTGNSNKQDRFDHIINRKKYKVVMQLGDNLNDFSGDFYAKNNADRRSEVDKMADKFGSYYIALPNASYGAWADALYGKSDSTAELKYEKRLQWLKGF